jgi:hypothetical protein
VIINAERLQDDHFVLCNHCLPVTVCYTFPLPESGFDREKIEKGEKHQQAVCVEIFHIFKRG